jgi:lipopolysaccharide export system protein LptC
VLNKTVNYKLILIILAIILLIAVAYVMWKNKHKLQGLINKGDTPSRSKVSNYPSDISVGS